MNLVGSKDLPTLRVAACAAVDAAAEACRMQFVTPGAGQAMAYIQKAAEAQRFLAAYPTAAGAPTGATPAWPWLSAEVGVTASTLWSVAQTILGLAAQFVATGSAIEQLRMGAKDAIGRATSPAAIAAAQAVTWPTPNGTVPET